MPALPYLIAGGQFAVGALQRAAAKRRRKKALSELKYDIPSATLAQVQLMKERASRSEMPGADIARGRMESDIAEAVSRGESVSQSPGDVLGLYAQLYGSKMDTTREIMEQGARYKSENELQLAKSLGALAEAENQQFYYNRMVPFLSEMGYAGDQAAGGSANIAGGLSTAFSTWANQWALDEYKNMYGSSDPTVQPPMAPPTKPPTSDWLTPESEAPLSMQPWMTDGQQWASPSVSPRDIYSKPTYPAYGYNIGHPNREDLYRPGSPEYEKYF